MPDMRHPQTRRICVGPAPLAAARFRTETPAVVCCLLVPPNFRFADEASLQLTFSGAYWSSGQALARQ